MSESSCICISVDVLADSVLTSDFCASGGTYLARPPSLLPLPLPQSSTTGAQQLYVSRVHASSKLPIFPSSSHRSSSILSSPFVFNFRACSTRSNLRAHVRTAVGPRRPHTLPSSSHSSHLPFPYVVSKRRRRSSLLRSTVCALPRRGLRPNGAWRLTPSDENRDAWKVNRRFVFVGFTDGRSATPQLVGLRAMGTRFAVYELAAGDNR